MESAKHFLLSLANTHKGKDTWVVEGETHINVGLPLGINGTMFAVRSPMTCSRAVIFPNKKTAEQWGVDYHLVYSDGNPVENHPAKADEFFERESKECEHLPSVLSKNS
ncbi:MAG: hypothetical protein ACI3ZD_05190 [Prevotella sp.]